MYQKMSKNVLILERSSENLKKIDTKGKTILEGVFAEFGRENRNGRIYEEKVYLPHLEYLKKDIDNGNLLGELDHPERFEVALGNVSHRITELWYDQNNRQVKGKIELLEGTPKGQIAKTLLEAGVPLSISSRAAGTVNENKTVDIQQIYTFDLVAKPGFETAQLEQVNEQTRSRVNSLVHKLNESHGSEKREIKNTLGILNENLSIIDVSDKFPALNLREEAKLLTKKNNIEENKMEQSEKNIPLEEQFEKWSLFVKSEMSKLNEKVESLEKAVLEGTGSSNTRRDIKVIKRYIEKLRGIQESALDWQSDIARAVNKLGNYSNTLAERSNKHFNITKKLVETVDHNAKTLNVTQDWISENAQVTNAIGRTVDHNAKMLNGVNEWNTEIARAVNKLHEWGTEKARAINDIHEWTSSIAKALNETANWSEDMFGRAVSKQDAKKIIEYVELVNESKKDPELKKKLDETLSKHGIDGKSLNESLSGISTITDTKSIGTTAEKLGSTDKEDVEFDEKTKTLIKKIKKIDFNKSKRPSELDSKVPQGGEERTLSSTSKPKGVMTLDATKTAGSKPTVKIGENKPKTNQNLKLDVKPEGKMNESFNRTSKVKNRSSKLDEKLSTIINTLNKEKSLDEELKNKYPFTSLLSESDRKRFGSLEETKKQKVVEKLEKNPTTDPNIILKLWESAVADNGKKEEPMWLTAAPEKYKKIWESLDDKSKEAIKAKSEFFVLETQYQVNNFWETSGLIDKPENPLNEALYAKKPQEADGHYDSFVSQVGEMMKRFNN